MMKKSIILSLGLAVLSFACCDKPEPEDPTSSLDKLYISVPAQIKGYPGDKISCDFPAGKGPAQGDKIDLQPTTGSGSNVLIPISQINETSFIFYLPKMNDGTYDFRIRRNDEVKNIRKVTFQILDASAKYCSQMKDVTDDIIYSSGCGSTYTSVQQGFDFTTDDDYVYFSQVHNGGLNTIGWGPRTQISKSFDVTPNRMNLKFFSHVNNIYVEKRGSDKYVWIGNYGTRKDDGDYTAPQIVSVIKLEKSKTMKNVEATENYYFGIRNGHQSIDWKNDQIAIFNGSKVVVYSLSAVKATPVTKVTLASEVTYGGGTSSEPEFTGFPVVQAHDCRTLTPLYTFSYSTSGRGLVWQTWCIADGRAYFFMGLTPTSTGYYAESVIEVVDMKTGKILAEKVKQPFANNIPAFERYGFTDSSKNYVENEGIIIRDGKLYLLYSCIVTRPNSSFSVDPRRPVIFVFDANDPAFNLI